MPRRPLRPAIAAGLAAAAMTLTGACNVDIRVGLEADADGGGVVRAEARLDPAAVAQLGGDTPEKRLALDDLTEAGWDVDGPTRSADGGIELAASHPFADGAEARRLVEDLAGAAGPFREVDLRQDRSFLKTVSSFRAVVDLTGGLGAFTDPDLREALAGPNGEPLGVTDQQLATRFGAPVESLFDLSVEVDLPGRAETNAPAPEGGGAAGGERWTPTLGQRIVLEASSARWNIRNIASAATSVAAAMALAAVLLRRRAQGRDTPSPAPVFDQDER